MCGVRRADAAVAAGFVVAAAAEAVALHRGTPGLLAFGLCGAPVLAVLASRRVRPALALTVIAAFGVLGETVQAAAWPDADDSGGVWILALMLSCYSLGSHGRGRTLALGVLLPLLVVLAADLPAMRGWELVSGVVFVTTFVGLLATAVGRVVRVRRERLHALEEQRGQILREQLARQEAAVLAERLRATERLQPGLLDGLRALAASAEAGTDPAGIETAARRLLGRTREEVVALTAPVDLPTATETPPPYDMAMLRSAAQRWTVLGAGTIAAGLTLESTSTLPLAAPVWTAVLGSVAVGVALALVWWRPLRMAAVAWCAAAAFSHQVAPLDGTLSGTAMSLSVAFAVAVLCPRRWAVAGLLLCWLGQLAGVGTDDPAGEAVIILICWLGGLAVNEASRLVEQTRANNTLLSGQEVVAAQRAIVEERLRMAREIHDEIGHTLTVVALQAGAARRIAATDPARAAEVMRTIADVAREGATGVGIAPDAADLGTLVQRTRAAGLVVDVDLGDSALLGPQERALVFRVVQEALTNVLRHAPGARATVSVRRAGGGVVVEVANTAPTGRSAGPGTGRGLSGIRERVAAAAGSVSWARRADGGFEVRALLPAAGLDGATP